MPPGSRRAPHRRACAQVDSVYFPQHEVVGDIGNGVWQIKEALLKAPLPTWDLRCAARNPAASGGACAARGRALSLRRACGL